MANDSEELDAMRTALTEAIAAAEEVVKLYEHSANRQLDGGQPRWHNCALNMMYQFKGKADEWRALLGDGEA